jgi:hypothetical protein
VLVMSHRATGQRGQGLLLVLVFVAAFLLVVWAALTLASGAFLNLSGVLTDTKETYALDAGLAYAIETNDSAAKGAGCQTTTSSFQLPYATTTITVTATSTPVVGCKTNKPVYTVLIQATGTTRTLTAQISSSNAGKKATWAINWESFQ